MRTFHWIFSNPGGVKKVREKLPAQLSAVARETALLRVYSGVTSGGYTQPIGLRRQSAPENKRITMLISAYPHVGAKNTTNRYEHAMMARDGTAPSTTQLTVFTPFTPSGTAWP